MSLVGRNDFRALAALITGAVLIGLAPIYVRLSDVGLTAVGFWRMALALPMLGILMLRESGGGTAVASEEEILAARDDLAHEGLFVEPTAALTLAAARHLLASGQLKADQTNVVMLGGSGLKAGSK